MCGGRLRAGGAFPAGLTHSQPPPRRAAATHTPIWGGAGPAPAPGSRWLRGPASQLQPNFPARSGPGDAPGISARSRRLAEQPGRAWPPPASPAARAPGEVRPGRSAHAHTRSPGARARLPPPSPPAGQSRSAVIGLPDCRRTPTQIGRPGQYRLRRREAGVARERVETTPVTGFPAARSGSGVGWRKERGRGAEGGSGGRLRASLRADRLGRRPARSGVGAAASAARPLGPDSRRASGRRAAAAARGQARGSPPRDVSGSRPRAGGPGRAQPGGPRHPCPLRGPRGSRPAAGAGRRGGAAPAGPGGASSPRDRCSWCVRLLRGLWLGGRKSSVRIPPTS